MLELKTKKELAGYAFNLARGSQLVRYHNVTYMPVDFETPDLSTVPDPERTIWLPLNRDAVRKIGASEYDILFSTDGELASFEFMVAQTAQPLDKTVDALLVRTPAGLKELDSDGQLVDVTGDFRPNTLLPMLNEDVAEKTRVFEVIAEWVNGEEDAHSLLKHVATALAPGWSAVKYVLLLGEGRNGKGLFLKMMAGLFGQDNIGSVTRQAMAEQSPMVLELNGKLLNIVYDGQADYVKDSGTEKTLIAGEPVAIRPLYQSSAVRVQTNALFVESLNHEPKTRDKSSALQKRLVRFGFPNIYALDHKFERLMLSEESLGAFLSLLIDHYVHEDDVATQLAPTQHAIELQLEQLYVNSIGLQYLKYLEETDVVGATSILGQPLGDVVKAFQSWRIKENDLGTWAEPDVQQLFQPLLNTERKTKTTPKGPRKVRVVTSFKDESTSFIAALEGTDDVAAIEAVVED